MHEQCTMSLHSVIHVHEQCRLLFISLNELFIGVGEKKKHKKRKHSSGKHNSKRSLNAPYQKKKEKAPFQACVWQKLKSQLILFFNLFFLLFMSPTVFFGTIHRSHCIISTNFYLYLQYF